MSMKCCSGKNWRRRTFPFWVSHPLTFSLHFNMKMKTTHKSYWNHMDIFDCKYFLFIYISLCVKLFWGIWCLQKIKQIVLWISSIFLMLLPYSDQIKWRWNVQVWNYRIPPSSYHPIPSSFTRSDEWWRIRIIPTVITAVSFILTWSADLSSGLYRRLF